MVFSDGGAHLGALLHGRAPCSRRHERGRRARRGAEASRRCRSAGRTTSASSAPRARDVSQPPVHPEFTVSFPGADRILQASHGGRRATRGLLEADARGASRRSRRRVVDGVLVEGCGSTSSARSTACRRLRREQPLVGRIVAAIGPRSPSGIDVDDADLLHGSIRSCTSRRVVSESSARRTRFLFRSTSGASDARRARTACCSPGYGRASPRSSGCSLDSSRPNHPRSIRPPNTAPFSILAGELAALHYAIRRVRGFGSGDHLYARPRASRRGAPFQLLLGHMDTVWPLGTLARMPRSPRRRHALRPR